MSERELDKDKCYRRNWSKPYSEYLAEARAALERSGERSALDELEREST